VARKISFAFRNLRRFCTSARAAVARATGLLVAAVAQSLLACMRAKLTRRHALSLEIRIE
jgi:hypothetical protein